MTNAPAYRANLEVKVYPLGIRTVEYSEDGARLFSAIFTSEAACKVFETVLRAIVETKERTEAPIKVEIGKEARGYTLEYSEADAVLFTAIFRSFDEADACACTLLELTNGENPILRRKGARNVPARALVPGTT